MKKVYRVWESTCYGDKECAFLSSFKAACDYIKAQIKDSKEMAGYHKKHAEWWISYTDEKFFINSLKKGYSWGGRNEHHYMAESYYIETILLEN